MVEAGKPAEANAAAESLVDLSRSVTAQPASECEFLYGRAGCLYALLWVRSLGCGVAGVDACVAELISQLLHQGAATADGDPALRQWGLMYSWHGTVYLGAAHGLAGIVHVLLSCEGDVRAASPNGAGHMRLQQAVCALVDSMRPVSGNLPSSLGSESDRLVQWCHGSPGLLPVLERASAAFGGETRCAGREPTTLRQALQAAADDVFSRGLLKKGVGLCHGIAGNAYALLSAWRATGEQKQLNRAAQFALFAASSWQHLYNIPDHPASLYEGLCGAVCLWLDMLDPGNAAFPAYELPPQG